MQQKFGLTDLVHYADDYFLVSGKDEQMANQDLRSLCGAFHDLGIPLSPEKIIGPLTQIVYLGIEINSITMSISVPDEKYQEIMAILPRWLNKRSCTKQQLLSLIGKLSFICKVVRPGRIFLRRLIDLSMTVDKLHHHININVHALADIKWWIDFLPTWNKKSLIPENFEVTSTDLKLFTDASNQGFGAIWGDTWIQGQWDNNTTKFSIDAKELFAIVAASVTWGHNWEGKRIIFITDNLPITQVWHVGTSKSVELMSLVRRLYLIAAQGFFSVSLKHILGVNNPVADAISRFQVTRLRHLQPSADLSPSAIPMALWDQ